MSIKNHVTTALHPTEILPDPFCIATSDEIVLLSTTSGLIHVSFYLEVNVTDLGENWATGKTHIDSALQTLRKGLSALLDMIVAALKVIAKVASMLLEIIKKVIKRMLTPLINPIKKKMKEWGDTIIHAIQNEFADVIAKLNDNNTSKTRLSFKEATDFANRLIIVWSYLITPVIILNTLFAALIALNIFVKSTGVGAGIEMALVPFIHIIIMSIFSMAIFKVSTYEGDENTFYDKLGLSTGFRNIFSDAINIILYKFITKKITSFTLAVLSILSTILSLSINNTIISLLLDQFSFGLAMLSYFIHQSSPVEKGLSFIASLAYLIDKFVIFSALGISAATYIVHKVTYEYNRFMEVYGG